MCPRSRTAALTTLLLLAGFHSPLAARADELDDLLRSELDRQKIPGISVAVARDGEVIETRAVGLADVELDVAATPTNLFEIGSITKSYTAILVMRLVEEGKLGLDDPIRDHLEGLPESWSGVTVQQLLNHTSGIPSYTSVGDFLKLARDEHRSGEIIEMVSGRDPDFGPGEKWAYNNTGYYLLGLLIEKVTGSRYEDFLKAEVLEPLGLEHTRPSMPKAIIPGRASGYGRVFGILGNRDPITKSAALSAGCLIATAEDVARYAIGLDAGKPLKPESFEAIYRPATLNDGSNHPYGFGWGLEEDLGMKVYVHGGGTPGFSSVVRRYPERQFTVVVLTNLGDADPNRIAREVAKLYLPELTAEAAEDPDPARTSKIEALIRRLLSGEIDDDAFTPTFAEFLRGDPARKSSAQLHSEGELTEFAFVAESERSGGGTALVFRGKLGDQSYLFEVYREPDGPIGGLRARKD